MVKQILPKQEIARLRKFVEVHGVVESARRIGCNRGTVANALAGLPVHAGTVALIGQELDKAAKS